MSGKIRYVAKAEAGIGWRIWDRKTRRYWGNFFAGFPDALILELNGEKRLEHIVKLSRSSFASPSKGK
jgi:hypothetical protein